MPQAIAAFQEKLAARLREALAGARRRAHPAGGRALRDQDRRRRGAVAARDPRRRGAARPRQGRRGRQAPRFPHAGAEPRGEHLGSKSADIAVTPGVAGAEGADRADARAGPEHRMTGDRHPLHRQRALRRRQDEPREGAARSASRTSQLSISLHHAPAAAGRGGRPRLPLRRRARVRAHARRRASSWRAPRSTATATAPRGHGIEQELARRARRAAGDRLAGRAAGAQARSRTRSASSSCRRRSTRSKARLTSRGQDSAEVIARRLAAARGGNAPRWRVRLCYYQPGLRPGGRRICGASSGPSGFSSPASSPATAT